MGSTKKKAPAKKRPVAKKKGRPTIMTEATIQKILDLIASSDDGVEKICKINPGLPGSTTIWRWLTEDASFRERYARAREHQTEFMVDQMVAITKKHMFSRNPSMSKTAAIKLHVENLKWIAAKLKPKKYGDKTDITTDGQSLNPFLKLLQKSAPGNR